MACDLARPRAGDRPSASSRRALSAALTVGSDRQMEHERDHEQHDHAGEDNLREHFVRHAAIVVRGRSASRRYPSRPTAGSCRSGYDAKPQPFS